MSCELEGFVGQIGQESEDTEWCWAACASMVLSWNRTSRSQRQIVVDRYDSFDLNRGGWPLFFKTELRRFRVSCSPLTADALEAEVCGGRPLILATRFHMVVAIGWSTGSEYPILIIDPALYEVGDPHAGTMSLDQYRTDHLCTYHSFGVPAEEWRREDPDTYCLQPPFAEFHGERFTDDDLAGPGMADEVQAVLRATERRTTIPEAWAAEGGVVRSPLQVYRLDEEGRLFLYKKVVPFQLQNGLAGLVTFRRLPDGGWTRSTGGLSRFAGRVDRIADERRAAGKSVDLVEGPQGTYVWGTIGEDGQTVDGAEKLPRR